LQLSELGTRLDLSFSSHVVLGNKIIALDGIKKKLLVAEMNSNPISLEVIDLGRVNSISTRKTYSSIKPGDLNKKEFDEFLKTIHLQFEYKDGQATFVLPFYESDINSFKSLSMLEKNARNWQLILSKMIVAKTNKIIKVRKTQGVADVC